MSKLRSLALLMRRPRVLKLMLLGTALLTAAGGVLLLLGHIEIAIGIVLAGQFLVIIHLLGMRTAIREVSDVVVTTIDQRTATTLTEITRSREVLLHALTSQPSNTDEK